MKTIVVTSGYFNPIHPGHLECFELAKKFGEELWVIVNNDKQAEQKRGVKSFQDENFRLKIVGSVRYVDRVILSLDQDPTVCKTLEKIFFEIKERFGEDTRVIFAKGGDKFSNNIPEMKIIEKLGIELVDGLGAKTHNSSDYI